LLLYSLLRYKQYSENYRNVEKILLDEGASFEIPGCSDEGEALRYAVMMSDVYLAKTLIDRGHTVDITFEGMTSLAQAIMNHAYVKENCLGDCPDNFTLDRINNSHKMIKLLLHNGADLSLVERLTDPSFIKSIHPSLSSDKISDFLSRSADELGLVKDLLKKDTNSRKQAAQKVLGPSKSPRKARGNAIVGGGATAVLGVAIVIALFATGVVPVGLPSVGVAFGVVFPIVMVAALASWCDCI
jgi:hypothetical protein